jgi:hypothetical protein
MKSVIKFVVLLMAVCSGLLAQVEYRTVVISPRVGESIDAAENSEYGLFPAGVSFKSARFLKGQGNKFFVEFTFSDTTQPKLMDVSPELLLRYTERVELKDAMEDGIYKPGFSKMSVDSAGGKFYVKFKNDYFTKLPFVKNLPPKYKFHPLFGLGVGTKFMNTDLSGMKGLYDYVEETIRSNGFAINPNSLDDGPKMFVTGNFYLTVFKSLGLYMEAGKSVGSSWNSYYTSIAARYYYDFKDPSWLKLYAGAGYAKIGYKSQQTYGSRFSTINSYGEFWQLDSIKTEASSSGFVFNLGSEIGFFDYKQNYYFTLFADVGYSVFPEKIYTVAYQGPEYNFYKTASVKLGGFSVSTGIKLYL